MKFATLFLTLCWGCLAVSPVFAAEKADPKVSAAILAAEEFLGLVDAGQYERSWDATSDLFRSQVPKGTWVEQISRVRPQFGKTLRRTLQSAKPMTSAPGVPDGEYVLLVYQTRFEKKQDAIETITPSLDMDETWRVSG